MSHGTLRMFTKGKGEFVGKGQFATLKINVKFGVRPIAKKEGRDTPDYELVTDGAGVPIGKAWIKTGKKGKFLTVMLDDPSFDQPLYVTAFPTGEVEGDAQLFDIVWRRPRRREDQEAA